jgi:hypothetical protein
VDDGSSDGTFDQLVQMHREDPRYRALSFSRTSDTKRDFRPVSTLLQAT